MLNDLMLKYSTFSDTVISRICYSRNNEDIGNVQITLSAMNAQRDYRFDIIEITFFNILKLRFVENENTSSLIINASLIEETNDIIMVDFFPLIYKTGLKENPESDFQIKCKKIEFVILKST